MNLPFYCTCQSILEGNLIIPQKILNKKYSTRAQQKIRVSNKFKFKAFLLDSISCRVCMALGIGSGAQIAVHAFIEYLAKQSPCDDDKIFFLLEEIKSHL